MVWPAISPQRFAIPSTEDGRLGIAVAGAGSFESKPSTNEVRNRTLDQYAAVLISSGHGYFEAARAGRREIVPGTLFWLFPNEPHSYAPHETWVERWIIFGGSVPRLYERTGLLRREAPLVKTTRIDSFAMLFDEVIDLLSLGGPMAGLLAGAKIPAMVAQAALASSGTEERDEFASEVGRALRLVEEEATRGIGPAEIARRLGIGYSTLRRRVREQTGMGLKDHILRVRLRRAKELLAQTRLSIAEIAHTSGFQDAFHFSRIFCRYEGIAPSSYRHRHASWAGSQD